jgi:hypothetical protein
MHKWYTDCVRYGHGSGYVVEFPQGRGMGHGIGYCSEGRKRWGEDVLVKMRSLENS